MVNLKETAELLSKQLVKQGVNITVQPSELVAGVNVKIEYVVGFGSIAKIENENDLLDVLMEALVAKVNKA
jgi:hypothetical protein